LQWVVSGKSAVAWMEEYTGPGTFSPARHFSGFFA
jgi:hypothetical protein